MCANCVSTAEVVVGQALLVTAIVKEPVHRALAELGLVAPPDPVGREARTVMFLRRLELDPVEIVGAEMVARADAWVKPAPHRRVRWARPIGSQSLLAAQ